MGAEEFAMAGIKGGLSEIIGDRAGDLVRKYGGKAVSSGLQRLGFDYGTVMKKLGGGVKKINKTVNGITSERVMQGWAKDKVAVIGRDQAARVDVFAQGINAETWKGFDINLTKDQNMENNKAWVQKLKNEGYTIYDTGTGPKSSDKGDHYAMETKEIFGDKK